MASAEEGTAEDPNCDLEVTMDKVLQDIFASCDPENIGVVSVSILIEFIKPFMKQNLSDLLVLQNMLDPQNINICVSSETFYRVMGEWTVKVKSSSSDTSEDNFKDVTPRDLDKLEGKDLPFIQSTPRASFGHRYLKTQSEPGILNVSDGCSYVCGENTAGLDYSCWEEQVQSLTHQNRKITDELAQLKWQLTTAEEQNETMQADIDRLTRRLASEQQINEQLAKNRKESEELRDTSTFHIKQVEQLKKQLSNLEKNNDLLQDKLNEMEIEKSHLENKIKHFLERENEMKRQIVDLQKEVNIREDQISHVQIISDELKHQIEDYRHTCDHYKNLNEELQKEKFSLERILQDKLKKHFPLPNQNAPTSHSLISNNKVSGSRKKLSHSLTESVCLNNNTYTIYGQHPMPVIPAIENLKSNVFTFESPLKRLRGNKPFNSPKLLRQLANPVLDDLDSPLLAECPKLLSFDSPEFFGGARDASTPKETKLFQKHLLDCTPPIDSLPAPALHPVCMNDLRDDNNRLSEGSPPVMYVIERSDPSHISEATGSVSSDGMPANSSEDESMWKTNILHIAGKFSPHDSLHAEMLQVTGDSQHQNCTYILTKQRQEIEKLKTEQEHGQKTMQSLIDKIAKLQAQVSISADKESMLIEMKSDLESKLDNSKTYVTEVKMRLSEFSDIEEKCKYLERKVEELEEENRKKYVEIVDLMENKDTLENELQTQLKCADECRNVKENLEDTVKEKTIIEHQLEQLKQQLNQADNLLKYYREIELELNDLKHSLENSKISEMELKSQLQVVLTENCSLKENVSVLETSVKNLGTTKAHLDESIKILQRECNLLKEELNRKEHKFFEETEEIRKQLQVANDNYESIKICSSKIREELAEDMNKELEDLEKKMLETEAKLVEKTAEVEELRKNVQDQMNLSQIHEEKVLSKNNEINQLHTEIKELENTRTNLLSNFHVYESDLNNKNAELTHLKSLIEIHENKIRELEKLMSYKDSLISEYKIENDQQKQRSILLKNEIEYCNKHIEEQKNIISQLETALKNKIKDCEVLSSKNAEMKTVNNKLCEEVLKVREENKIYKDLYNQALKHNQDLLENSDTLSDEFINANQEEAIKLQRLNKLTGDNLELQLTQDMCNESEILEKLKSQLLSVKSALEEIDPNKTLMNVENEKEAFLTERHEWLNANNEISQKIAQSIYEINLLYQRIERMESDSEMSSESCRNCLLLSEELQELKSSMRPYSDDERRPIKKDSYFKRQIKVEKLQCRIEELEKQLDRERSKIKSEFLHEEITSKKRMDEILQELENSRETMRKLTEENNHVKSENLNVTSKLASVSTELNKAESKIVSLKEVIDRLHHEATKKKVCIEEVQAEASSAVTELDEIKSKLHDSNSKLASLLEDAETFNSQMMEGDHPPKSPGEILNYWRVTVESYIQIEHAEPDIHHEEKHKELVKKICELKNLVHFTELFSSCLLQTYLHKTKELDVSNNIPSQSVPNELRLLRKRFTLAAPGIDSRPMSPDSPSFPLEGICSAVADGVNNVESTVKENDVDQFVFEETYFEKSFPNLPDAVLECLGLSDGSARKKWTEEEMEEKFTVLIMAFSIDAASIKERHRRQCSDLQEKTQNFSKEMSVLLNMIEAMFGDAAIVKTQVDAVMQASALLSASAKQFGAIREERRIMKCIGFIHNYVSVLRQKTNSHQFQCTECIAKTSPGFCEKCEKIWIRNNLTVLIRTTQNSSLRKIGNKVCRFSKGVLKKMFSFVYFMFFVIGVIGVTNIYVDTLYSPYGVSQPLYPWSYLSWEEIFAPVVKRTHRDGLRPY